MLIPHSKQAETLSFSQPLDMAWKGPEPCKGSAGGSGRLFPAAAPRLAAARLCTTALSQGSCRWGGRRRTDGAQSAERCLWGQDKGRWLQLGDHMQVDASCAGEGTVCFGQTAAVSTPDSPLPLPLLLTPLLAYSCPSARVWTPNSLPSSIGGTVPADSLLLAPLPGLLPLIKG